jgi:hypothetical protein
MRENIQSNLEDNIYEIHENLHEIQQNIHETFQENIKGNIQQLHNRRTSMQYARMMAGGMCSLIGTILAIYVGAWLMILTPVKDIYTAFYLGKLTTGLIVISTLKCALSLTTGSAIWCGGYILKNKLIGYEE